MFKVNPLARRLEAAALSKTNRTSRVSVRINRAKPDPVLFEAPQHLELMAARLQNGENIYSVLVAQAQATGAFALAFRRAGLRLELGESIEAALRQLAVELKSPIADETIAKILWSLQRGTPMASQLLLVAASCRVQQRVYLLKLAGRNELRMLIPLVFLILPVTIAFAVLPSLQQLQLGV